MIRITSATPTTPARTPSLIESAPSEGQIARFLQRLVAELDLAVRADLATNHRRLSLRPAVEDDRHVVADVPRRFIRELSGPTMAELECDDRLIGHRIAARGGFDQLFPGNDRASFHRVERPIGAGAARLGLGTPP